MKHLLKKDGYEEDLVLSPSPKYVQAILIKLVQEEIVDSPKEGWLVDYPEKVNK